MLTGSFRRLVCTQGIAIVLTAVVACGAMDWAHSGWDDPGCDPIPVQHDHAKHRFIAGTRAPAAPSDHCALCHLLRVFHTALSAQSPATPVALSIEARGLSDGAAAIEIFSGRIRSRAPPAFVL